MKTTSLLKLAVATLLLAGTASCEDTALTPSDGDSAGQGDDPGKNPDDGNGDGQDGDEDGDDNGEENPGGGEEQPSEDLVISSAAELGALGDIPAGSTVVWKDGVYEDAALVLGWTGTEENPIVFRAETPGGVTFTGASSLTVSGSRIEISGFRWRDPEPAGEHLIRFRSGSSHCVLEDCEVDGSGSEPRGEGSSFKWVSLYGTGHTVTRCAFNDKKDMGALLVVWLEDGVQAGHVISHNSFSRPETILDSEGEPANEQEVMRIGDSSNSMQDAGCIIENNYFHSCNGEKAEIVSNKSCGNVYRGNAFFESCGTLTLRHGNNCTVSGNFFYGSDLSDTGGVRIIGEGHTVENNVFERLNSVGYKAALCICAGQENPELSGYWQVKNATVRANVFIDCNLAMHINYGSSSMVLPVLSTVIEDNVAVTPEGPDGSLYVVRYENTDPQAEITWSGNTFYGRFRNNYFGLTSVKTRPEVSSCLGQIEDVASAAGPSWDAGQ